MSKSAIADVSTAAGSGRDVEAPRLVPALTIVSHPVAHRAGERLLLDAVASGREVSLSRNAPDFAKPGHALGTPLADPFVSRRAIRFAPGAGGGVRLLIDPGGTPVVAGTPIDGSAELTAEELAAGIPLELAERVVVLLHLFDRELGDARDPLGMVGDSAGIRRVRTAIERIVDLPVPVLIRGETGTGKELVARAIHDKSPRRDEPFQIRDGRFKAPLLHRLAGYEVRIPPLRARREDIGPLFYHFAHEELAAIGEAHRLAPEDPYGRPWLPAPLAAQLVRHAWPGNIRQLRNVTRQLVIGSRGLAQLRPDPQLAQELAAPPPEHDTPTQLPVSMPSEPTSPPRRKPGEVTETELLEALRACAWDLKAAADRLRIPRPSMYDLIDKSPNIRTAGDLGAEEITLCFQACSGDLDAMAARLQVSRRALHRRVKELGLIQGT